MYSNACKDVSSQRYEFNGRSEALKRHHSSDNVAFPGSSTQTSPPPRLSLADRWKSFFSSARELRTKSQPLVSPAQTKASSAPPTPRNSTSCEIVLEGSKRRLPRVLFKDVDEVFSSSSQACNPKCNEDCSQEEYRKFQVEHIKSDLTDPHSLLFQTILHLAEKMLFVEYQNQLCEKVGSTCNVPDATILAHSARELTLTIPFREDRRSKTWEPLLRDINDLTESLGTVMDELTIQQQVLNGMIPHLREEAHYYFDEVCSQRYNVLFQISTSGGRFHFELPPSEKEPFIIQVIEHLHNKIAKLDLSIDSDRFSQLSATLTKNIDYFDHIYPCSKHRKTLKNLIDRDPIAAFENIERIAEEILLTDNKSEIDFCLENLKSQVAEISLNAVHCKTLLQAIGLQLYPPIAASVFKKDILSRLKKLSPAQFYKIIDQCNSALSNFETDINVNPIDSSFLQALQDQYEQGSSDSNQCVAIETFLQHITFLAILIDRPFVIFTTPTRLEIGTQLTDYQAKQPIYLILHPTTDHIYACMPFPKSKMS